MSQLQQPDVIVVDENTPGLAPPEAVPIPGKPVDPYAQYGEDADAQSAPAPGSWADVVAVRGRGPLYAAWGAAAFSYVFLEEALLFGEALHFFVGAGLLLAAGLLMRRAARKVGALVLACSALLGIVQILTDDTWGGFVGRLPALALAVALLVWAGRRIAASGGAPLDGESVPAVRGERVSAPVRAFGTACIVTGVVHLILVALVAKGLEHAPALFYDLVWFPERMAWPDLPGWSLEVAEDLLLVVAGIGLHAGARWSRAALATLSGSFAFWWCYLIFSPYRLSAVEYVFTAFWLYGFLVLASRARVAGLRCAPAAHVGETPVDDLHRIRRFLDDRQ